MGIEQTLYRATDAQISELVAAADTGVAFDAFLERAQNDRDDSRSASIDKAWHALHFLLRTSDGSGGPPPDFLSYGAKRSRSIGVVGCGLAHAFTSGEVKRIAAALAVVTPEDLRRRNDPYLTAEFEVHPALWWLEACEADPETGRLVNLETSPGTDGRTLDDLLEIFARLKAFVLSAAADGKGVVTYHRWKVHETPRLTPDPEIEADHHTMACPPEECDVQNKSPMHAGGAEVADHSGLFGSSKGSGGAFMIRPGRLHLALALVFAALSGVIARAEMPPQSKEQATLIVEGVVRQAFRSVRTTRIDFLFEIQVRSAQVGSAGAAPFEGPLPRPGDLIYALAFQRRRDAPRVPGPVGYLTLPAEHDIVRAFLYPRTGGGWQLAYPLGFERLGRGEAGPGPEPTDFRPEPAPGVVPPRRIGVMLVPVAPGNRAGAGLQVTEVTPGSPARRAGLEPGDLILEADNVATRTPADMIAQVARAGGKLHLLIRNFRSGQVQPLDVDLGGPE